MLVEKLAVNSGQYVLPVSPKGSAGTLIGPNYEEVNINKIVNYVFNDTLDYVI